MKKLFTYMILAAMLLCLAACDSDEETGQEERMAEVQAEQTASTQDPEALRAEWTAPFAAALDGASNVVRAAASAYVPPVRTADGALLLTYDDLVARLTLPETAAAMQAWYKDTLFIGDSRTVGMAQYSGLTEADFFALTGMSVFDAFEDKAKLDRNAPDGTEIDLGTLLTQKQYKRIYLMLGINELGYSLSSIEKKYEAVTAQIKALQPEAELWLQANMHVTQGRSDKDPTFNNTTINALNAVIRDIAARQGTHWLDINPVFDDENGHLGTNYTFDHTHIVGKHYKYWALWIYLQSADQLLA